MLSIKFLSMREQVSLHTLRDKNDLEELRNVCLIGKVLLLLEEITKDQEDVSDDLRLELDVLKYEGLFRE